MNTYNNHFDDYIKNSNIDIYKEDLYNLEMIII